jgi:hypothetical protein
MRGIMEAFKEIFRWAFQVFVVKEIGFNEWYCSSLGGRVLKIKQVF